MIQNEPKHDRFYKFYIMGAVIVSVRFFLLNLAFAMSALISEGQARLRALLETVDCTSALRADTSTSTLPMSSISSGIVTTKLYASHPTAGPQYCQILGQRGKIRGERMGSSGLVRTVHGTGSMVNQQEE